MNNFQYVIPWIPVIATLFGACFGLFASLIISYFNKSTDNRKEKEERNRKRLERIYELAISAKNDRAIEMAHLFNWIHSQTNIPEDKTLMPTMPPLIELEMLVKLYLPTLEKQMAAFVEKLQSFTAYSFEIKIQNFNGKSLDAKQAECAKLWEKMSLMETELKGLQGEISKIIKA